VRVFFFLAFFLSEGVVIDEVKFWASTSHDQKIVVLDFGTDLDTSLFV
jgi:hypothetical protein